jgi:hypothetical protein
MFGRDGNGVAVLICGGEHSVGQTISCSPAKCNAEDVVVLSCNCSSRQIDINFGVDNEPLEDVAISGTAENAFKRLVHRAPMSHWQSGHEQ